MIIDKVHKSTLFKKNNWLEKSISFKAQKMNQAVNDF